MVTMDKKIASLPTTIKDKQNNYTLPDEDTY